MASLMLKSVYAENSGKPQPIIVDLGYTNSPETRERYEALLQYLPRRRFSREGHDRLMAEIPPTKAVAIFAALPIVEGSTYWRATHHWRGLGKKEGQGNG